ncbi:MAG: valine--tRNA ligase [Chloroflexi bacterium]|nr:MAG: valine--tRNA ligase [Chloroflexota bacterium]
MERPPESALTLAEKNFRPSVVESDLYSWWERSGFFTPDENNPNPPFVMMLPLPNVTGDLHLGHALGFGGYEDLMARWHRMKGEPTLYMPGTDHAGIIAQYVVEQELAKEGISRGALGREKFLEEMWKWMDHYRPRIEKQLRMLGCSLDWSRPNFTMEPAKQRAVRTHFIRLFKHGHLYRADRIVHWCLRDQTTYSDLEVEHVQRTDTLYHVRYPWADPMPAGTPDLVVATTRPETIVADVAVAVHPDDERWRAFVGKHVLVPGIERRVPIIADAAVDREFGTGALKITPGHDATDFEIGQRHGLPTISAIDKRGMMTANAGPLAGPDRETARRQMVKLLRDRKLLVREEPITHAVGVHDRCQTVDEPLVMKQWWVSMAKLAPRASQVVRDGLITIVPRYQEKVFFNWMDKIRDWPVSRQIWWGHSIPAWFCSDCDEIVVPDEDAPDPTRCTRCRSDEIKQDPDVLDTWFSSALWPHSTLGWPDQTPDLRKYYPGSVLETGYDILFFWVARMIMMGLENMGEIPFHTVYLHGLVDAFRGHPVDERPEANTEEARWILSRTEAVVEECTRLIESYLFGEYLAALEGFAWGELADLYIELAKRSLRGPRADETVRTLVYALDRLLRLAHPIVPFLTETLALQLWHHAPKREMAPSLVISAWPRIGRRDTDLEARFAVVSEVVRTIRNLRQDAGLDPSGRAKILLAGDLSRLGESISAIAELTRSDITTGRGEAAATVVRGIEIRLVVERDAKEERGRIERELAEARERLKRSQDLLGKPGFVEKAPADVVNKERAKLKERESRLQVLEDELKKLRS